MLLIRISRSLTNVVPGEPLLSYSNKEWRKSNADQDYCCTRRLTVSTGSDDQPGSHDLKHYEDEHEEPSHQSRLSICPQKVPRNNGWKGKPMSITRRGAVQRSTQKGVSHLVALSLLTELVGPRECNTPGRCQTL